MSLRRASWVVAVLISACAVSAAQAAERHRAAEYLPATTVIYAEVSRPQQVLDAIYDDDLVRRVEALEPVKAAMEKKPYLDFKAGVAIVESQMGMPWRKLAGRALGGGVAVGVDAKTRGVAILAQGADGEIHQKMLETLANLASMDAKSKGNPDPTKTEDYRGVKVYAADKNRIAVNDDWLIVATEAELVQQIVDRMLDGKGESLQQDKQFTKARGDAAASPVAWAYVNTATLREAGLAKKLFGGQAENPAAELLFGGVLAAMQHTPYVTLNLASRERHVTLSAAAPYDKAWAEEKREYFFGPEGKGVAPDRLAVDDAIFSLSSYRDISAMWVRAGDLFNERTNDELAKADSNLTTLFGGKDFGEDILGALKPQVQFVVARQTFADSQPKPAIQLPEFGFTANLKDAAKMQPELRRTFQSLIGFLNVVGATNGQPQLDIDMEKADGAQFVTASYISETTADKDKDKEKDGDAAGAKINYNFSPSIAFIEDRFILASTTSMARKLTQAKTAHKSENANDRTINTDAVLEFATLQESLRDNRGQLVAQNMLKEGHSKAEAERDIGILLELVGWFDQLGFSLDTSASEMRLNFDLGLKAL